MDRQELTDIVLRNIGGSIKALEHYTPRRDYSGLPGKLLGRFSRADTPTPDEDEKKERERHQSYLDALREYYDVAQCSREPCLKNIRNFLVSQYESFNPCTMCDSPRARISETFTAVTKYGQFLIIAAPFTMFEPANYVIGGLGMASIIINRFVRHFINGTEDMKKNFEIQAREIEDEYREKREAIRASPLSEFDEILQQNKKLVVPYL